MVSFLRELWVPILLAGVLCFIVSTLAWMVFTHHRSEWHRLPTESDVLEALRKDMPPPGLYAFPFAMRGEAERADVKAAYERGPVGYLTIANRHRPNVPGMATAMLAYFIVVSFCIGYVAWAAAPAPKFGAPEIHTARITWTVALLAYAASSFADSVWFARPWRAYVAQFIDAALYATVTAAVFVEFWPQ
ncbi:MAG: hypothetical protein HY084_13535 [Gemmatimonadetes bacterium]|nr:hypothetical protein [Gemmatimonadota bacterium]